VGRTLDVIVDKRSDERPDVWIARTKADAPDIDCVTWLTAAGSETGRPLTGQILPAEVVAAAGYDLAAVPVSG
jgi:ribosomal protein S12 methylthiotransferase